MKILDINYWNHNSKIAVYLEFGTLMTISKGHVEFETYVNHPMAIKILIDIDMYNLCCFFALWEEVYGEDT